MTDYVPNGGASLVGRLAAELRNQWESNHFEHCGRDEIHADGRRCMWPAPPVLTEAEHVVRVLSSGQRR